MKRKNFFKCLLGLPLVLKAADTLTEGDVKMKGFRETNHAEHLDVHEKLNKTMEQISGHNYSGGYAMTCSVNYPDDYVFNPKAGKYYGGTD